VLAIELQRTSTVEIHGNEDRLSKLRSELLAIDFWDSHYFLIEPHRPSDELAYQSRQVRREEVLQEIHRSRMHLPFG
jgi:hypothetical protein